MDEKKKKKKEIEYKMKVSVFVTEQKEGSHTYDKMIKHVKRVLENYNTNLGIDRVITINISKKLLKK